MDVQALLHNRWALAGLGLAAAAGGYVWWRRSHGGAASSSSSATDASAGTPAYTGGPGTFDSTGTDVASWLGNYSGNLQNQLDDYQKQLTDALAGLQNVPTAGAPGGTGSGTGVTLPHPTTPPNKPLPNKSPKPRFITTVPFTRTNTSWRSTLSGIAKQEHTSVAALLRLNPSIKNPNQIGSNQKIRVA